jgi:small multidrug resistance family-3 protein
VREHRGWLWVGTGVIALGAYGFVAAFQPDAHFGRVLAAHGGAVVSLIGVGLIMYGPR